MKKIIFLFFLFSLSLINAQNPSRKYLSHSEENNALTVKTSDGNYIFKPYSEGILETSFVPTGENFNSNSHAVVMQPNDLKTAYSYVGEDITYGTKGMTVTITTSPFKISYKYKGKELISEKRGFHADSLQKIQFNLDKNEVLYGGGARALGMNRRGYRLELYNKAHYGYETHSELMNFTMPIVISSKRYMIHFDNAPIGYLDLDSKKDNTLQYETISGRMTYQIVSGDDWKEVMGNYTNLTGRQPMIPRWALGNFASRFGYHSQMEATETIDRFFEAEIPVDAIILDLYWFGKDIKGHMGNFEFERDSFPTPKKMIKDLAQKGVKTLLITEPFILSTSKNWDEAVEKKILGTDSIGMPYRYDFYFGNTGLIDIYKKDGKDWFWNIYRKFTSEYGVGGWWGDLGEPEVHPSDLQHAVGSADEVHNTYGHDWARLVYEGYQRDFPDQRPFILMRAGYSGSQRFGMIPWSGDVNRSWGGLQPQPEIALQMGMQGMGFMHSDLGGFAGDYDDDELYIRWLQYGVFQPIYRPHAQESVPSEPVYKNEHTKELAKQAIELRYRLLPYNYNAIFQNHRHGIPLMRPLFFEDDSEKATTIANTYFWGDDFLISPVMKRGETTHEVYFPKGSIWFDFYSSKKFEGGNTAKVEVKEEYIPTFVRGGSFIPMVQPVQTTEEYSIQQLDLHFFYDDSIEKSKRTLYNDDGKTPKAFEKEKYEMLRFESCSNGKTLRLSSDRFIADGFSVKDRNITLKIHGLSRKPRMIRSNGKKVDFIWKDKKKIAVIKTTDVFKLKIKL
ncbi:TIM-barrel domain-containing protein [Sungkyunkwania multivorans]|uniref:TIM-barrel domain-containing protein n=1 Tax=Sungkyunkwania multivorans TaxID=1173618 RepID=A0ABW3D3Z4_9FLAO